MSNTVKDGTLNKRDIVNKPKTKYQTKGKRLDKCGGLLKGK